MGRCGAACGTTRSPMGGCGAGNDDCWSSTSGAFCSDARARSGAVRQTRSKCIVEESTAAGSATAEQLAQSTHPPMPPPPLFVARSVRLSAQNAVVTHDDVVKTISALCHVSDRPSTPEAPATIAAMKKREPPGTSGMTPSIPTASSESDASCSNRCVRLVVCFDERLDARLCDRTAISRGKGTLASDRPRGARKFRLGLWLGLSDSHRSRLHSGCSVRVQRNGFSTRENHEGPIHKVDDVDVDDADTDIMSVKRALGECNGAWDACSPAPGKRVRPAVTQSQEQTMLSAWAEVLDHVDGSVHTQQVLSVQVGGLDSPCA